MSRRLVRLARLEAALSQGLRVAKAEALRSAHSLEELRGLRAEIEAAIARQHAVTGLILSPVLNRLAAIGLRVMAAELDLKTLQAAVHTQAVRLELVGRRLQAGRAEEARDLARKDLEDLASRLAGTSLPQGAPGKIGR